jgi:UDPglucose 6-dehydrogenase
MKNVTVIGLWHLGTITAACLASSGYKVTGIDLNQKVVSNLQRGKPPLYEPGLAELIKECVAKKTLSFTKDFKSGLKESDYVIIAFDTPVNDDDTPDLSPILESITKSVPYLQNDCLIVISSQVPIGTCEEIKAMIQKKRKSLNFGIACIPENLKLGEAISRFKNPDLIVIGTDKEESFSKARELYGFVDSAQIRQVNLRTAEMVKHAMNAFLANQVSFANEMGNVCDRVGVDWFDVIPALHLDKRVGEGALLRSGLGFGGGTLARDVGVLRRTGKKNGVDTVLLDAVMLVNRDQNMMVVEKLRMLFGNLKGLRVGVLGLTYKPGTSTIRRSASVEIIKMLKKDGVSVKAYDPKASFSAKEAGVRFERCKTADLVARSSDALLILTAWPEFKELDFARLKSMMSHQVIIDALNMLDQKEMARCGFIYVGLGRGLQIKHIAKQ